MESGIYQLPYTVQPDVCDISAALSPLGVFNAFQAISAEHAEVLGIGVSAVTTTGKFWVTVHNRIEFTGTAMLLERLNTVTWPVQCLPEDMHVFRGYELCRGDQVIARGKTQWAIIDRTGKALAFKESGFPENYQFAQREGIAADPVWFEDDFTQEDQCGAFTVRSTDVDFGRHMNNIAYIRKMLDQFPAKQIRTAALRAIEIHYGHPCFENEQLDIFRKPCPESSEQPSAFRMAIKKKDGTCAAMGSIEFQNPVAL